MRPRTRGEWLPVLGVMFAAIWTLWPLLGMGMFSSWDAIFSAVSAKKIGEGRG
ncbi:MAG: hypothetical protein AAFV53_13505 [Myxococcota bacterium]